MENINQHLGSALQTLITPTRPQPGNIEASSHDFGFAFVGNESPEERAALDAMLAAAVQFAGEVLNGGQPRWLTLCGKSGTGKTYLAKALSALLAPKLQRLYETHERPRIDPNLSDYETAFSYAQEGARFTKWPKMVDEMRDGSYGGFNKACRDWFKIVDEIGGESKERLPDGSEKPTVFATGKLSRLFDDRLGKWTVFTSNYLRRHLGEVYDARIASRLMRDGNVLVELPASVRDFNLRREALAGGRRAA